MDLASPAVSGTSVYANGLTRLLLYYDTVYFNSKNCVLMQWRGSPKFAVDFWNIKVDWYHVSVLVCAGCWSFKMNLLFKFVQAFWIHPVYVWCLILWWEKWLWLKLQFSLCVSLYIYRWEWTAVWLLCSFLGDFSQARWRPPQFREQRNGTSPLLRIFVTILYINCKFITVNYYCTQV